jgi:hypothetical protein
VQLKEYDAIQATLLVTDSTLKTEVLLQNALRTLGLSIIDLYVSCLMSDVHVAWYVDI